MNKGFCYQENTHFSQAVRCSREKFWDSVRNTSTAWKIDSRREILEAVEQHNSEVINKWLKNEDYGKFLAKKRGLKKLSARQKFFEKSDEERLLAFAQELKDNLVAFIFSCYEFDATETAKGTMFCHRRLADCHLNGLVMLDIDHVDNPLEIFEALKANQELMARTALAHITSSKKGIRIIFTADIKEGNLADNQIVFAEKLSYKADSSCIDATRNSFAPKEEDILYINEDLLFDYYDEDFDREYTYCLIIMTKISTGSTLPCIVTRKRSRYIMSFPASPLTPLHCVPHSYLQVGERARGMDAPKAKNHQQKYLPPSLLGEGPGVRL